MYSHFEEVVILKFGDIIIAVVSSIVIMILISFPLMLVLTPTLGDYNAFELSGFVSFILSPIIVGYIFSQKIREENRIRTIAKIALLVAVFAMFVVIIEDAATGDWTSMIKEDYMKNNPTADPSASEWYNIELRALASETSITVTLMLAITFIGLYIGSMLKKTAKS